MTSSSVKGFLCGVCEGFYGRPWSTEQRLELFERMRSMGMNTYMYAPKDDYKHRNYWRDLYTVDEAEELKTLISAAKANDITFVYAISPGFDITYSDAEEKEFLNAKLKQLSGLGCEAFAVLFDDIDVDMGTEDEKMYKTFAHAQADVTNKVYHSLGEPAVFLFCPTEYCASRAEPDVESSKYLIEIGEKLHKNIDVFWTGPKVVSKHISTDSIEKLSTVLKRKPVIWDNIHANDYDQARIYLGPYDGRPPGLVKTLNGVLTNPNCEYEANFIAMHTLATWTKCSLHHFTAGTDIKADSAISDKVYQPREALQRAVEDWLPVFFKEKGASRSAKTPHLTSTKMEVDSPTSYPKESQSLTKKSYQPKRKTKVEDKEMLTTKDIFILVDLFYLPHYYGQTAVQLINDVHWLIENADLVRGEGEKEEESDNSEKESSPETEKCLEWYERQLSVCNFSKDISGMVERLGNISNRSLLYDLYSYVCDMDHLSNLVKAYIRWLGNPEKYKHPTHGYSPQNLIQKGGLYAELRRLLAVDGIADMYPPVNCAASVNSVHIIRPYLPTDKGEVYKLCSKLNSGEPSWIADSLLGPFLELCSQTCYVIEQEGTISGYAVATQNRNDFLREIKAKWFPQIKKNYTKSEAEEVEKHITVYFDENFNGRNSSRIEAFPSLMCMGISKSLAHGMTTKRLFDTLVTQLKANKSTGIVTSADGSDKFTLSVYSNLGFEEVPDVAISSSNEVLAYKI